MSTTQTIVRNPSDRDLMVAVADAHAAAEAASRIAAEAVEWSGSAGAGADDANEALRCAMRARTAAERAEHRTRARRAWADARLAWAAVSSVVEASARVNAAIAELLAVG